MNKIAKALKWGASALRVAKVRVVAGLEMGSRPPQANHCTWARAHG